MYIVKKICLFYLSCVGDSLIFTPFNLILRWQAAEEKEPYEAMARADSRRYKEAMAKYKSGAPTVNVDSVDESE